MCGRDLGGLVLLVGYWAPIFPRNQRRGLSLSDSLLWNTPSYFYSFRSAVRFFFSKKRAQECLLSYLNVWGDLCPNIKATRKIKPLVFFDTLKWGDLPPFGNQDHHLGLIRSLFESTLLCGCHFSFKRRLFVPFIPPGNRVGRRN